MVGTVKENDCISREKERERGGGRERETDREREKERGGGRERETERERHS